MSDREIERKIEQWGKEHGLTPIPKEKRPPKLVFSPRVQLSIDSVFDEAFLETEDAVWEALLLTTPECFSVCHLLGIPLEGLGRYSLHVDDSVIAGNEQKIRGLWADRVRDLWHVYDLIDHTEAERQIGLAHVDELRLMRALLRASTQIIYDVTSHKRLRVAAARRYPSDPDGAAKVIHDLDKLCELATSLDPSHHEVQFLLQSDMSGHLELRPIGMFGAATVGPRGELGRGNVVQPLGRSVRPDALAELASLIEHGGSEADFERFFSAQPDLGALLRVDQSPISLARELLARGVRPAGITIESIAQLRRLVDADAPEEEFQRFLEAHPQFLIGSSHVRLIPKVVLHRSDEPDLIPDFFMERLEGPIADIVDLKRSTSEIMKYPQNRLGFRGAVHAVADQLREYRDWFDSPSNRRWFREKYGLTVFKPKVVAVIGRSPDFAGAVGGVESILSAFDGLPRYLDIVTYDDLLLRAQKYLEATRRWRR